MKLNDPRRVTGVSAAVLAPSLTPAAYGEEGTTVGNGTSTVGVLYGNVPTAAATVYVIDKS